MIKYQNAALRAVCAFTVAIGFAACVDAPTEPPTAELSVIQPVSATYSLGSERSLPSFSVEVAETTIWLSDMGDSDAVVALRTSLVELSKAMAADDVSASASTLAATWAAWYAVTDALDPRSMPAADADAVKLMLDVVTDRLK